MRKLLSVGRQFDSHISRVHSFLRSEGIEAHLVPSFSQDPTRFHSASWGLDLQNLTTEYAFWLRNKHRVGNITDEAKQQEWWSFATTMDFFRSVASLSPLAINGTRHLAATDSKIPQLMLAKQCGFRVPATLVSNEKAAILEFLERHPDAIVKILTGNAHAAIGNDERSVRFIPSLGISEKDVLAASADEFLVAPNIFQERIKKRHELRVIAFNEESVTILLDSQKHDFTSQDWRFGERLLDCPAIPTPEELKEPISKYFEASGLHTAVFDFAVTPDGEAVFFESNPDGQWARMDDRNDLVISKMFSRQIASMMRSI